MPVNNGIITAPVSIEDVAKCLGVSSFDLGTLCANGHGKINKWSVHCPIKHDNPGELTSLEWDSAAFGFVPSSNTQKGIALERPSPNTNFRLTDFDGYNHNSICGIAFKEQKYSVNLLDAKSANGLTVSMYTDPGLITLKSFANTLLKGEILEITANANGIYHTISEPILASSSLSWTIPRSKLIEMSVTGDGEGRLSVKTKYILLTVPFTIEAKTEYVLTGWGYNMGVSNGGEFLPARTYRTGQSSNGLSLNGNSLYLNDLGFPNGAYNKTLLQFQWTDQKGMVRQQRATLIHDGNPSWSGSTGGIFSVSQGDIPVFSSSGYIGVQLSIVAFVKDYLGVEQLVRISDIVTLNLLKTTN